MFRVLVTERIAEDGLEILRSQAEVDVRMRLTPAELVQTVPGYHALVVRSETKVTADVIEAGRDFLVIGRAGVGVDNIDVAAAARPGGVGADAAGAGTHGPPA